MKTRRDIKSKPSRGLEKMLFNIQLRDIERNKVSDASNCRQAEIIDDKKVPHGGKSRDFS